MDGFKVCAKLSLHFLEHLPGADAEATLDLYARAFAQSLEEEISNGRLPVDDSTLHDRITARVTVTPRHRVRLSELHVEKASTSQTLPAVTGQTLPAASGPSVVPAGPPSPRAPASTVPPSLRSMSNTSPPAGPPSAVVPKKERSPGFALALERSPGHMLPVDVGVVLADSLRDAAGSLLLAALDSVRDTVADPMRIVDGRLPAEVRRGLVTECSACVAYLLLDALIGAGIPQKVATVVTQAASARVVAGHAVPGADISRYLAIANPAFELANRLCDGLGVSEPPELQPRIGFVLHSVKADVKLCAERLRARAVRPGS
jgi:hypothetical protein